MKLLVVLSILQTAALAVLIAWLLKKDMAVASHETSAVASQELSSSLGHTGTGVTTSVSEQTLRQIVREELAARESGSTAGNESPAKAATDSQTLANMHQRRDTVLQKIESYKSIGAITDQQMEELHEDLGKLDDTSRKQAMSVLIRAMNEGTLKGRL